MQLTELQEVARALNIFGSIKAINTIKKEGAPDNGRNYYEIYFDAADAAHVGLAALKEVFDVSNPLLYISPLSSNVHFGRYFSGTLASSARLELLTFTRLPLACEPTILLTNIAPSDQPSAKLDQLVHSGPICCQFKDAPVCWPFVVLPVCQVTISLSMRQSAVSLPVCLFAVNMLDAGFKDSILTTLLFEQALSSHKLQSGLPAPCCHHIQKRLLSSGQTPHTQACPAQYIASEKHPLQQRVSLPGDIISPKSFSSVPELIKLLTTAVTAVAPGAAIKPLQKDANSSSNVGKLVVTVQVHTRPPLFLLDLASSPSPLLQPTATALPSHIHSHAHRSSKSSLFTFSQVPMH
jgi:hypothetical protein